jgi:hypothetical protein
MHLNCHKGLLSQIYRKQSILYRCQEHQATIEPPLFKDGKSPSGRALLEMGKLNAKFGLKGNGSMLGIGLAWSPVSSVGLTGEYLVQTDELSVPEVKSSDGTNLPKSENQFRSSTLLAGDMFSI